MPYVDWPGGRGYYAPSQLRFDAGARPAGLPVVLIHGAGGSHLDWPPGLRRPPEHTWYAIDLPAHGRTPGPARASISEYARWLLGLLHALHLPPAVLLGHSMGAAVAVQQALDAPDTVAGLVLLGAGSRLPVPAELLDPSDAPAAAVSVRFVDLLYGAEHGGALRELALERLRGVDPEVLQADLDACRRWDVSQRLGELHVPALVMAGEEDRLTPVEEARRLHAGIRGSELLVLASAGHMMLFERAGEVQEAVQRFLGRLPAA